MRGSRLDFQMVDTFAFSRNKMRFGMDIPIDRRAFCFVFDITNAETFHQLEEVPPLGALFFLLGVCLLLAHSTPTLSPPQHPPKAYRHIRDLQSSNMQSLEGLVVGMKADAETSREVPQQETEVFALLLLLLLLSFFHFSPLGLSVPS